MRGDDSLDGGAGNDLASYAGSTAGVTVELAAGTGSGGDAEGDTLANIENLEGSEHGDTLTGDAGGNTVAGGAGNDLLIGEVGGSILGDFESGTFGAFAELGAAFPVSGANPDVGGGFVADVHTVGGITDASLEASLDLPIGTLDGLVGGNATAGSAVSRTIDVNAGDGISFDWFFETTETNTEFRDFAFFTFSYAGGSTGGFKIAEVADILPGGDTIGLTSDGTGMADLGLHHDRVGHPDLRYRRQQFYRYQFQFDHRHRQRRTQPRSLGIHARRHPAPAHRFRQRRTGHLRPDRRRGWKRRSGWWERRR